MYADVIIDISHEKLDRTFQYKIPERLLEQVMPGSMVEIPFGNSKTPKKGYVVSLSNSPAIEEGRIRSILSVVTGDTQVESSLVALAAWMQKKYGSTYAASLRVVFPMRGKVGEKKDKYVALIASEEVARGDLITFVKKHQVARARLLEALLEEKELQRSVITNKLNVSGSVITALCEMGLCKEGSRRIFRGNTGDHFDTEDSETKREITLTSEQQNTIHEIQKGFEEGDNRPVLIRGVTGSGKTEVYIRLAEETVAKGKQVIVLIPEIALTYQTLMRFYRKFGDRVATLHSRLSDGEKQDQFERARRGELSVIVGPRSALFAPFSNLGLIIMDEEHEGSYKSEKTPSYHAREVAIARCEMSGAHFVMGSATPSVESYYKAKNGKYRLFELHSRATGSQLAAVQVIDLRQELRRGNRSIFSELLKEKIQDRMDRKEQVMLFLNRRGFAGFVSCRACGHVFTCPHCDVSLSAHRNGRMVCHYCGYEEERVNICPECGSKYIGTMKAGTEQIEQMLNKDFPEAKVLRMDMDTTRSRDSYEQILSSFANREADILVGTQMIVKGHDFPYVTLVGVLAADLSLYAGDYSAGERTFQLLTQAVGRAGRGSRPGEAIIQTYSPDHPCVIASANQDYEEFYSQEMEYRSLLGYPPAAHIMAVLMEDKSQDRVEKFAAHMKKTAAESVGFAGGKVFLIGPAAASIAYIRDVHRQVLYLKSTDEAALISVRESMEKRREILMEQLKGNVPGMQFDLDPIRGY